MRNCFVINEKLNKGNLSGKRRKLDIKSAFSIECGLLGEEFFYKILNSKKIAERYSGDYIEFWKEYYRTIKQYVDLIDYCGIMETDSGEIIEISKCIPKEKMIEGTPIGWEKFYEIYLKILREINLLVTHYNGKVGMDTSIWNFTTNGELFDLDPPRLFKGKESVFSNKKDKGHYERTFYRNFTEEGMKTNLLATILLGLSKGNIIVNNKDTNYISRLLEGLINSFDEQEVIKKKLFSNNNQFYDFENHPIKIIRDFIQKNKEENKSMNEERKQKFIFVTGPSESGKSGAVIHMTRKFPGEVKHLKIRNIFREMYERTNKEMSYEDWYQDQTTEKFEEFWDNYIRTAKDLGESADIVVMDTLYGVDEIKFLHSRLGKNVGLLYIDAPLQDRITREYTRLRTDSPYSDRKADLTVTREQIEEQTKRKDEKKRMAGAFDLKRLAINENGKLEINDNALVHFADVINNNGTLEEFEDKLDKFINKELQIIRRVRKNEGR